MCSGNGSAVACLSEAGSQLCAFEKHAAHTALQSCDLCSKTLEK